MAAPPPPPRPPAKPADAVPEQDGGAVGAASAASAPHAPNAQSPIITIAVSSRALFDFEEENRVFEEQDERAYMNLQRERLEADAAAAAGIAYPMVKKLLAFNKPAERLVDVVVVSRNDPITGLRVIGAIRKNKLDIQRSSFTRGSPAWPYVTAFGAQLFLSASADDVKAALDNNVPAARVMGGAEEAKADDDALRIAFDGDAVLFADDSERVFQEKGLEKFQESELRRRKRPMKPGPMKQFLDALCALRARVPPAKIRLALVTARGAPADERAIRTLMDWGVDIDEVFFLAGREKAEVLRGFRPDFFFDDQVRHLSDAVAGGHVDAGVINRK